MNTSGHQFRRYARRTMGRRTRVQAQCECGRWSRSYAFESEAWADHCEHADIEARKQVSDA